jgi:hypothetical protein
MPTPDDIKALAEKCEDPVWFAENVLGETTWSKQRELLRAVRDNDQVAIRSGHKTSKSRSFMVLALWWAFKWHLLGEDARVALSAASFNQVKDIAWREIRAAYKRTPILQQVCIKPPSLDPATGLTFTSGNQIFGFSAKEAENAAGISSPHVMYLLDEASGIQDAVFSAMEGNMAGGAKMVMASQGTKMSGHFFDAFNKYRASWHCIKISSWDSPNVTGEVQIPGLATGKWCQQKRDQWGEDSPLYRVRVMGDFPGHGDNTVYGLETIEFAKDRWPTVSREGALRLGVDVARFGDDETVIFPVRGHWAMEPVVLQGSDGVQVASKIVDTVRRLRRDTDREIEVKIDEIGLGASPVDALSHMDLAQQLGIRVRPIHLQSPATDSDNYADAGSEMAFDLADWLRAGGAVPDDSMLIEELASTTYTMDTKGRRKVADKKKLKTLIRRSPDRRNALELAIYDPKPKAGTGASFINII